jgi:hypothetical protein
MIYFYIQALMVQLVDHLFDGGKLCHVTVLRSLVQFPLMLLFYICQISHGHVIYYLFRKVGSCLA